MTDDAAPPLSHRQPIRPLHQKHILRRGVADGGEIATEAEVAEWLGLSAVLVPDQIERRAGAELPSRHGAGADAAEIEVGVTALERSTSIRGGHRQPVSSFPSRANCDSVFPV